MRLITRKFSSLLMLATSISSTTAMALTPPKPSASPNETLTPELIYQYPLPTWIENLAVRSNGSLLLTLLSNPTIYTLNPHTKISLPLTTIPSKTSLFAIAEGHHDEFYVSAGNFSITTGVLDKGSFALYRVTISSCSKPVHPHLSPASQQDSTEGVKVVKVVKVVDLPQALLLNGMATIPNRNLVLIPDSYLGQIFVVNSQSKTLSHTITLPEFHSPANTTSVGLNGIKLHASHLYFTISTPPSLYRVPFNSITATIPSGAKPELLATDEVFMDDFAVSEDGRVWVATNRGNVLLEVDAQGRNGEDGLKRKRIVAGRRDGLELAGPTACAFGRGRGEEEKLYVGTTGGLGGGVEGGRMEGGKVVRLDTKELRR